MARIISNAGTPIKPVYAALINDEGIPEVVKVGEENLQDEIDSFAEATDINNIIARYTAGDQTVLDVTHGVYGDFTTMPKTYAQALQTLMDAENQFNQLPSEVRQKFDNNYLKFMDELNSDPDSFNKHIGAEKTGADIVAEKKIENIE